MTARRDPPDAPEDLGRSWLASAPHNATVLGRDIDEYQVAAIATEHFSARRLGCAARQWFPLALVPDGERALLVARARFWVVTERLLVAGSGRQYVSGLALRRPGVDTAEAAFDDRRGGAS